MDAPCKYCSDRKLGCHGICRNYQQYAKKLGNAKKSRLQYINWTGNDDRQKYSRRKNMWSTHKYR